MNSRRAAQVLCPLAFLICLLPQVSSAMALLMGAMLAIALGNPYLDLTRKYTPKLLSAAVVGLGAGMDLNVVGSVGLHGLGYTFMGIALTLTLGLLLGRALGVDKVIATLVAVGTAICGGSAIAAVAPVINAKDHDVSVALGTVFLLNAVALVLFPEVGYALQMSEASFGLWSALAIHDTSSVVGATLHYGNIALQVGTTVKLARALWIVPVTLLFGLLMRRSKSAQAGQGKAKRPWFIVGFLLMAAAVTYVPALREPGHWVEWLAKRGLVLTLFLIGLNLTRKTLSSVGVRPLVQGVALWAITASVTLTAIVRGWIS